MSLIWALGACAEHEAAPYPPPRPPLESAPAEALPDAAEPGEPPEPAEDTDQPTTEVDEEAAYQALWAIGEPLRIRLELDDDARDALESDPRAYVCGGFVLENGPWGTTRLPFVGIRLKGSETFDTLDGKPSLKVDFDACVADQRYASLEHLTLNNMASDPAAGREVLAYSLLFDAGQPAPRATFAEVWIDDDAYGLYAALEGMDRRWVRRRYAAAEGDLWEADDGAELSALGIAHYSLAAGEGDEAALADAAAVVESTTTDVYDRLGEVVAMDAYLDFHGWSVALGSRDGYPQHLNDYFLYGDPGEGGRFHFSPWGMDETWPGYAKFDGGQLGTVGARCFADADCHDRLVEHTRAALDAYDTLDAAARAEALFAETADAVRADPRRPEGAAAVEAERRRLVEELADWSDQVRRKLP